MLCKRSGDKSHAVGCTKLSKPEPDPDGSAARHPVIINLPTTPLRLGVFAPNLQAPHDSLSRWFTSPLSVVYSRLHLGQW